MIGAEAALRDKGVVKLHAGKDGDVHIRGKVLEVVPAVVGQCKKVIAVVLVEADDLLRRTLAVGAGGVAVESALEKLFARLKGCLSN